MIFKATINQILTTHVELNANTASIYSVQGDGVHGHLTLTINAEDYKIRIISGVAFKVLKAPPSFPTHKDNATDAKTVEHNRQHNALLAEFVKLHTVDAIIRNLLIAAVQAIFLAAKCNPVTGFGNVTRLALLTHLRNVYGRITEQDLKQNIQRMRTQWNPPTAIESLFVQISFAIKGQYEPTKPTILRWAYEIISHTGRFEIACRAW
jgi:hypothetical protein